MTQFKGKAIYQPSGKAAEYSQYACNFYVGCSNECTYCYLKKGIGAKILGGNKPTLKKCFRNSGHAKDVFEEEMWKNRLELRKHGLFFSFTTDPFLDETIGLTCFALTLCLCAKIPVKILTKRSEWVDGLIEYLDREFKNTFSIKELIAFGFTLTGHDELEPNASTNAERIKAMKKLHDAGFKTFASIEPIVSPLMSYEMMYQSYPFCDMYMIGLMSGKKYDVEDLEKLYAGVNYFFKVPIYWKDSFLKATNRNRADLPENCVTSDFNLFK